MAECWFNVLLTAVLHLPARAQMAVLEMKELNERQRADHSTRMYQKLKCSLDDLCDRNNTLEDKFDKVRERKLLI